MTGGFPCYECGATFPNALSVANHRRVHPVDPDATEKPCTACGKVKPLEEFSADKSRPDGRRNECRPCNNAYQTARRRGQLPRSRTHPRVVADPLAEWKEQGLCRGVDPRLFFPETGESAASAIKLCLECPVMRECRDQALLNHEFGVWGATTERDRSRMRRRRRWAS